MPLAASSGVDDSGRTFNSNSYFGRSATLVGCRPAHVSDKPSIRTPTSVGVKHSQLLPRHLCWPAFNSNSYFGRSETVLGADLDVIPPVPSMQTPALAGVELRPNHADGESDVPSMQTPAHRSETTTKTRKRKALSPFNANSCSQE